MADNARKCNSCDREFVVDEAYDGYRSAPYHYDRDGEGYCLCCFLGVGPSLD